VIERLPLSLDFACPELGIIHAREART
jgi:hypothetical protein